MMIFVYDTSIDSSDKLHTDGTWVHAMKQEDDGDWTSKYGAGYLYENIADANAFLDNF